MLQKINNIATPPDDVYPDPDDYIVVSGRDLNQMLATRNTADRAFLATDLQSGRFRFFDPTIKQAAALVRVCPTCVVMAKAVHAHKDLYWDVRCKQLTLVQAYARLHPHPVSDQQLADIVGRAGRERTWETLVETL